MATESQPIVDGAVTRVMVGTDRSETAGREVAWAASFAARFDAELHIVQVVLPVNPAGTEFGQAEATRAAAAAEDLQ
ncbi:MAG: universal stress protein, partial [Actinomycetota bacterium]